MLATLVGCGSKPATPRGGSVDDVCGRAPANLSGRLSKTTVEDIRLYVETDGNDATTRHVRESLAKEAMACDALSYRACEEAVNEGASQGLALELNRLAMGSGCQGKPTQPVAVAPRPRPGVQPTPRPAPRPRPNSKVPEWRPGKFMVQALTRVVAEAQRVQKTTNYSFDSTGSSVLGAFLNRGASIDMTRPLDGGVKYAIIGGGSDSVQDLDIEVFDMSGRSVAADIGDDNKPVVEFRPPRKGRYKIVLRLARTRAAGSFTAISILRSSGGYNVPMKNLATSFGSGLALAALANQKVKERGNGSLVFHADGDWCFYGTVMEQNESLSFRGVDLNGPGHVIMATTDGAAKDVDLEIIDSSNNRVVASDTADDNTPVTTMQGIPGRSFAIKMSTQRAPKPSMVTVMVLDVVK